MAETLYDTLGVAKSAEADDIRKAYRKLARKYHPDVNPGDKAAEDRFKKISAAYETLSDPKKRKDYDEFGDEAASRNFDAEQARTYQNWQQTRQQRSSRFEDGPVEFDFGDLFGGHRKPAQGPDVLARVQMDLKQALEGGEVALDVPNQGTVRVRIPPGADNGSTIRVPGKGAPGPRGGPPGDLVIECEVMPHPLLRREGLDLYMTVPVTLDEAYNGASIDIPTLDGPVRVKVPARSQGGSKLRLRGKGVKRKTETGDMVIVLDLRMPDKPDEALGEALRASASSYSTPVRKELML